MQTPEELTTDERIDRLERAVREIALYVAPHGVSNRVLAEPATAAIVEEVAGRLEGDAKDRHREALTAALEALDAEEGDGA